MGGHQTFWPGRVGPVARVDLGGRMQGREREKSHFGAVRLRGECPLLKWEILRGQVRQDSEWEAGQESQLDENILPSTH